MVNPDANRVEAAGGECRVWHIGPSLPFTQ